MERVNSLDPELFYNRMQELNDLYIQVKEVIILAENFDPTHEVYLSPLNELRNSYDHVMRIMVYPHKMENELNEAKEHLYRAGYDAYEVLAINVSDAIIRIIEEYNSSIITAIFPAYYQEIRSLLIELQVELAGERAHKRLNPETGTKSFYPYKEKVDTLLRHLKICEQNIPALQAEKKKKSRKAIVTTLVSIAIGVIITVAGTYVYDKYVKKDTTLPLQKENKVNKGDSARN